MVFRVELPKGFLDEISRFNQIYLGFKINTNKDTVVKFRFLFNILQLLLESKVYEGFCQENVFNKLPATCRPRSKRF